MLQVDQRFARQLPHGFMCQRVEIRLPCPFDVPDGELNRFVHNPGVDEACCRERVSACVRRTERGARVLDENSELRGAVAEEASRQWETRLHRREGDQAAPS
jgi:hypothetical protein